MISRHWKGVARPGGAEHYVEHLRRETFPELSNIEGFVGASILRRETARGVEFLIVTTWRSMEAIREFAGEAAQVAVVPPAVQALMVEYDREVTHYEVVSS